MFKNDPFYDHLRPESKYMTNKVILAQAWKKSQNYIRRLNWYSDILELDCSTIQLDEMLEKWSATLKTNEFENNPMRVVWAPKNQKWTFDNEKNVWGPDDRKEQQLRPLAHLSIKDQTIATAAMMCLADAVETYQGPTDEKNISKVKKNKLYSYGNRLLCNWTIDNKHGYVAKFRWGNSKCYREFFQDYQAFLKRPMEMCEKYQVTQDHDEELYVVSIDLSKFYSYVDIPALKNVLQIINKEYPHKSETSAEDSSPDFWNLLDSITSWKWHKNDEREILADLNSQGNIDEIQNESSGKLGLPQGLVASGFFANAYLAPFDRKIGENVGKEMKLNLANMSVRLLDYCRYVDDIRLVIQTKKDLNTQDLKNSIVSWLLDQLHTYLQSIGATVLIKINNKKTEIVPYSSLSTKNSMSTMMNYVQQKVSGPVNFEILNQTTNELFRLFETAETINISSEDKILSNHILSLSKIYQPYIDIKDDTLKRFVSTRIVRTLREKKSFSSLDEKIDEENNSGKDVTEGDILRQEFEKAARMLISGWSQNISLSLLLKQGLDLYPSSDLLLPVIEALRWKLDNKDNSVNQSHTKSILYVLSDLFRAASIMIGRGHQSNYFDHHDFNQFQRILTDFAIECLKRKLPWYVEQQLLLYLLSQGETSIKIRKTDEMNLYWNLINLINGESVKGVKQIETLTLALVLQQLKPDSSKFVFWFVETFTNKSRKDFVNGIKYLKILDDQRPDLLNKLYLYLNKVNKKLATFILKNFPTVMEIDDLKKLDPKIPIPIIKIVKSPLNPFKQENALLLLAKKLLLESNKWVKDYSIDGLKLESDDWGNIQNPNIGNLKFAWLVKGQKFQYPEWVPVKNQKLYRLGAILRSAASGEIDYTAHSFLYRHDVDIYKGIKSSKYSRAFSLINQGKGLIEESVPITPWLTELLYKLLQWPGMELQNKEIPEWDNVENELDVLQIIEKRLVFQAKIYGVSSNTPMYMFPVPENKRYKGDKLRIAVVQPLLPRGRDFNVKNPTNWNTSFRSKHSRHLSAVTTLLYEQMKATDDVNEQNEIRGIDLIVFPELSVHPDDIRKLRILSDKTKAHIFAGMTFLDSSIHNGPINQALWLIREENETGRTFHYIHQGKKYMTTNEQAMSINPHRPYQILLQLKGENGKSVCVTGSICYDATDMHITADLRDISDVYIIAAMNKDVETFDKMAAYLNYHMFQPVILANIGEYGGSTVQAPFRHSYEKTVSHVHGGDQIAISIFEIDPTPFTKHKLPPDSPKIKTHPAGYNGRSLI